MCLTHTVFLKIGPIFKSLEISLKTQDTWLLFQSLKVWSCGWSRCKAAPGGRSPSPLLLLGQPHCLACGPCQHQGRGLGSQALQCNVGLSPNIVLLGKRGIALRRVLLLGREDPGCFTQEQLLGLWGFLVVCVLSSQFLPRCLRVRLDPPVFVPPYPES